jgi:hypothetical protein
MLATEYPVRTGVDIGMKNGEILRGGSARGGRFRSAINIQRSINSSLMSRDRRFWHLSASRHSSPRTSLTEFQWQQAQILLRQRRGKLMKIRHVLRVIGAVAIAAPISAATLDFPATPALAASALAQWSATATHDLDENAAL